MSKNSFFEKVIIHGIVPVAILIGSGIVSWYISDAQIKSAEEIAKSNERLKNIEIFSSALMGNNEDRRVVLYLATVDPSWKTILDSVSIENCIERFYSNVKEDKNRAFMEFRRIAPKTMREYKLKRLFEELENKERINPIMLDRIAYILKIMRPWEKTEKRRAILEQYDEKNVNLILREW